MPKYKLKHSKATVELDQSNFKTKGGEGSIYIVGKEVFKICDPGKMIPEAKLNELTVLDHPRIVRPIDIVLQGKNPVGYVMDLVPGNARPLAQILTKAYQEREGVTPDQKREIVSQIASGLRFIHSHKGYLQVDGNEFNYMVSERHDSVHFIDVNSFQTPHFMADAIMPSIRDWHCPQDQKTGLFKWSELTDWYSFAIISFYLFTAIHPFKGRHPNFTNVKTMMQDQMRACKSVLDPEVLYPQGAVYSPFENYIPGGKDGAFMQWYKAIFIDNKRLPAPKDFQAMMVLAATIKEIVGSNNFNIRELQDFYSTILGFTEHSGKEIVVTKDGITVDGKKNDRPAERFRVGFTPSLNVPFVAWLEDEQLKLRNLSLGSEIKCSLQGTDMMSCEGRVYVQSNSNIFEITFIEQMGLLMATPKAVASIMPTATTMFQGVAFQDTFGTTMTSIFPAVGHHRQFKFDELKDYRITDAKYENGVLMIICCNKEGQYDRLIFRFDKSFSSYDVRVVSDITPMGINFSSLAHGGICVCLTEEEKIEIFSAQKGNANVKSIDDPAISADMRLCHSGNQVRFAKGNKLYSMAMKS